MVYIIHKKKGNSNRKIKILTSNPACVLLLDSRVLLEGPKERDGWRAFRLKGVLDFSLTGILAKIADLLAHREISIFAVSTYNTDYVLIKKEQFGRALSVLKEDGYSIAE